MRESSKQSDSTDLIAAARAAASDAHVLESLKELLAEAQQELHRLDIPCQACGKCCDFAVMDHRLFVSTAELALLAQERPPNPPSPLHCPYQQGNECTARDRRPLGCRVFYCNSPAQEPLHDLYERYHQRIAKLHQQAGLSYAYAEMTSWLKAYWVEF